MGDEQCFLGPLRIILYISAEKVFGLNLVMAAVLAAATAYRALVGWGRCPLPCVQFAFPAGSCCLPFQLASPPASGPLPAGLLLSQLSPACADAWDYSALGAGLCAFPS